MKLLREATGRGVAKLADIEHEARNLLSELDTLEVRLYRAHNAVSIDNLMAYLSIERNRMLEDEERANVSRSLAGFPILGILSLISLCCGQRPDWDTLVPMAFPEESFGDIRIAVSEDNMRLVNVSKMARERNMAIISVVAELKQKGNEVLGWQEFEARARNMREAVLSGKLVLEEKRKPQALPTGRQPKWVRVSSAEHTS